jgi:hypothetical protein
MSAKHLLKPILILVLAAFVLTAPGFGQTRRHDLSLSYGVLSIDQLADVFTDVVTIVVSLGTFGKQDVKYTGVPFLSYHTSRNDRFGFGAAFGGYNSSGLLRIGDTDVGEFKETNYMGAVELDYRWVMKPGFQLYSGVGFGVRLRRGTYTAGEETDTVNKALPTFHLNALGLRFGRAVGFFLELGGGYKGALNAGLSAQF